MPRYRFSHVFGPVIGTVGPYRSLRSSGRRRAGAIANDEKVNGHAPLKRAVANFST